MRKAPVTEVDGVLGKICVAHTPPTWLPLDRFYKRSSVCKECWLTRQYPNKKRTNNVGKALRYSIDGVTGKICSSCEPPIWKPLSEYNKGGTSDGHQAYCKECSRKANSLSHQRNRESRLATNAKWQAENRDKMRGYYQTYRDKDPIRTQMRNAKDNAARRARELGAEGFFNYMHLAAQWLIQDGLCYYCGHDLVAYHVEHKIPLSRGGTNWPDNIVLACAHCNLTKHTKTDTEFIVAS